GVAGNGSWNYARRGAGDVDGIAVFLRRRRRVRGCRFADGETALALPGESFLAGVADDVCVRRQAVRCGRFGGKHPRVWVAGVGKAARFACRGSALRSTTGRIPVVTTKTERSFGFDL